MNENSPIRVKLFNEYAQGVYGFKERIPIDKRMNAWFDEIAADHQHEYDIRQILPINHTSDADGILVFYEVLDCAPPGVIEPEMPVCAMCREKIYREHEENPD